MTVFMIFASVLMNSLERKGMEEARIDVWGENKHMDILLPFETKLEGSYQDSLFRFWRQSLWGPLVGSCPPTEIRPSRS